jgi:hypothetical protein
MLPNLLCEFWRDPFEVFQLGDSGMATEMIPDLEGGPAIDRQDLSQCLMAPRDRVHGLEFLATSQDVAQIVQCRDREREACVRC